MTIEIPDHLTREFGDLLDMAQALMTEEDIKTLTNEEKEALIFAEHLAEKLTGEKAIIRFSTRKQRDQAFSENKPSA